MTCRRVEQFSQRASRARACDPSHFKGENPLGSEANLVTARENRPRARASRSRCQLSHKREWQHIGNEIDAAFVFAGADFA
ncbi:MAG: hypothetical protein Udaeo2_23860 [Candidatus Udaeobacter sp.]|nr:MAG: hypothetical protein Udaeo2_23860 [Candidatus Udaeobacter sp.]